MFTVSRVMTIVCFPTRLQVRHCLVPCVMFCGAQAPVVCLQEVEEYVSKIKAAGGHATVHVYPGEGHAFMNSDPDSFKRMDSKLHHIMLFSVAYICPL